MNASDDLLARLRAWLQRDDEAERRSPDALAVAVSILVAVVLWFTFSMREDFTVEADVALAVARLPEGQALAARPPPTARATFRGEGWTLLALTRARSTVALVADGPGVDLVRAVSASGLPAGVRVENVRPRAVDLVLEPRVERRIPIRLDERIGTAPSFGLLRAPRLLPDSVTVTGAASVVRGLTAWPTETLIAADVRAPLTRTVALRDTLGGLVELSVRSTTVQVPVVEFTEGRRMLRVVVEGAPPGGGVRVEPAEVRASYRVPLASQAYEVAESAPGFVAVVDYAEIVRDTTDGRVRVRPRVPPGLDVRDVSVSPSRVDYFLVRRPGL